MLKLLFTKHATPVDRYFCVLIRLDDKLFGSLFYTVCSIIMYRRKVSCEAKILKLKTPDRTAHKCSTDKQRLSLGQSGSFLGVVLTLRHKRVKDQLKFIDRLGQYFLARSRLFSRQFHARYCDSEGRTRLQIRTPWSIEHIRRAEQKYVTFEHNSALFRSNQVNYAGLHVNLPKSGEKTYKKRNQEKKVGRGSYIPKSRASSNKLQLSGRVKKQRQSDFSPLDTV